MFAGGMKTERQGPPNRARNVFRDSQDKKDGKKSGLLKTVSQAELEAFTCVNPVSFMGVSIGTLPVMRWGN